ncbi:MAG: enoyl-CoA hydratase/isomerase family protein [Elusimicrobia bacterium]|nr:enoyl-CoA hydratase/isomerase family protein [Elusimicrobiota bacterium]
MSFSRLLVRQEGSLLRVTLNRPEVRNAMDEQTLDELTSVFKGLAQDKSVRAAVLSGAGADFCAGADINSMQRASAYTKVKNKKEAQRLLGMCRAVDEAAVPVIARVQGNCFGGGLGLVGACDYAVASDDARFCFSEVKLGIIPAVVSTFVVPKIGISQARRLFLSAEVFGADRAREVGLVHAVGIRENLDDAISQISESIMRNAPSAVRAAKAYLRAILEMRRARRISYSVGELVKVRSGSEAKEGFAAFLEKRPPAWNK